MCAPLSLAAKISNDPQDVVDDIHMAAASGTQLQEFFVTPKMLSAELWDAVAEAVGWVQHNADVLVDTHGIGGDPARGEAYGYASWSPRKGVLVLRNPAERPAQFPIDVQTAFELPKNAPRRYSARSPWRQPDGREPIVLQAGRAHALQLAPFEVVVLEAVPIE